MTPLARDLTDREEQVLLLVGEGLSHREIACRLAISKWTVKAHIANSVRKLDARSSTHAVALVVQSRA